MSESNHVEIRLQDAKPAMTRTERLVADYVERRLKDIPSMSIKQLAKRSGTSEASVLRFCKALGYRGYRDFILSLSADLGSVKEKEGEKKYTDIRPGDTLETIVENVSFNNRRSIDDTLLVLDKEQVRQAVELLSSAQWVDWYGLGASGLV